MPSDYKIKKNQFLFRLCFIYFNLILKMPREFINHTFSDTESRCDEFIHAENRGKFGSGCGENSSLQRFQGRTRKTDLQDGIAARLLQGDAETTSNQAELTLNLQRDRQDCFRDSFMPKILFRR